MLSRLNILENLFFFFSSQIGRIQQFTPENLYFENYIIILTKLKILDLYRLILKNNDILEFIR